MSVDWRFKKWLAVEKDIYKPIELQQLIEEKENVHLSLQSISALINGKPNALRLKTIQVLCNALDCKLSDFCDVVPDEVRQRSARAAVGEHPRRLYSKTPRVEILEEAFFPSARDFRDGEDEQAT